ncbi:hypothetical protein B0A55_01223 [Friedmanniomyces simplex]|uniref:Uncharacterized protein n=1 Tax=Friedmanniomyces simplex TaxID=329884 RepID=A0A4U0Y317_9PEZI|nr:hypothetical protein B0A55_01223 [Friedmanniomyces simplex]
MSMIGSRRSNRRAPSSTIWAPAPSSIVTAPTFQMGSKAGSVGPWDAQSQQGVDAETWRHGADFLNSMFPPMGRSRRSGAASTANSPSTVRPSGRSTARGSRAGTLSPSRGGGGSRVSSRAGSRSTINSESLAPTAHLGSEARAAVREENDRRWARLGPPIEARLGR